MATLHCSAGRLAACGAPCVRPPHAMRHTLCASVRSCCAAEVQFLVQPLARRHSRGAILAQAAVLDPVTAGGSPQQEEGKAEEEEEGPSTPFGLPLPAVRHQRPLDMKSIKLLRTECNTAARNKQLMNIQAGQQGITQTFLSACMDILSKRQFVRIRLGEGSGLERGETAEGLEKLLDSVCVHQIGYTITLYRQPGLPRPSNCPSNADPPPAEEAQAAGGAEEAGGEGEGEGGVAAGWTPTKGLKKKDARKKVRPASRKPVAGDGAPQEFQVL